MADPRVPFLETLRKAALASDEDLLRELVARRALPDGPGGLRPYGVSLEEVDRSLVGIPPANYREERA